LFSSAVDLSLSFRDFDGEEENAQRTLRKRKSSMMRTNGQSTIDVRRQRRIGSHHYRMTSIREQRKTNSEGHVFRMNARRIVSIAPLYKVAIIWVKGGMEDHLIEESGVTSFLSFNAHRTCTHSAANRKRLRRSQASNYATCPNTMCDVMYKAPIYGADRVLISEPWPPSPCFPTSAR